MQYIFLQQLLHVQDGIGEVLAEACESGLLDALRQQNKIIQESAAAGLSGGASITVGAWLEAALHSALVRFFRLVDVVDSPVSAASAEAGAIIPMEAGAIIAMENEKKTEKQIAKSLRKALGVLEEHFPESSYANTREDVKSLSIVFDNEAMVPRPSCETVRSAVSL